MSAVLENLPVFVAVFWKSGVVLGAALGASRMLARQSADLRRLVLSTAVIAMVVAPAAMPLLPRWTASTPRWFDGRRAVSPKAAADLAIEVQRVDGGGPVGSAGGKRPTRRIDLAPWLIPALWFAGASALLARFVRNLRGLRLLRKASGLMSTENRVEVRWSAEVAAPVVWGVARPVILVPAGFGGLPQEDREAVLRHELAHVEAHDFLVRAVMEVVAALIWFQPLVWVVRRHLREEQELACDDGVLAAGGKASAYARLLMEWEKRAGSELAVAMGVAPRSCLRRRLQALLDPDVRRGRVSRAGVAAVWVVGLGAGLPIASLSFAQAPAQAGASQSDGAPKPKFEVASIKPCQPGENGPGRGGKSAGGGGNPNIPEGIGGYFRATPGRLDITCGSILTMVEFAYVDHGSPLLNQSDGPMHANEAIRGVPKWAISARYTIHAKTEDREANGPTDPERGKPLPPAAKRLYGPMLQGLLEDRFQLKLHRETADTPMYALTVAKGGLKLKPMQTGDCIPGDPPRWDEGGKPPCHWMGWDVHGPNRRVLMGGVPFARLAQLLSGFVMDRNVIDRTGVTEAFVARLEYAPDQSTVCMGPDQMCKVDESSDIPAGPTIFGALEQQFGLKLEAIKGPRESIVIDGVKQPSEN